MIKFFRNIRQRLLSENRVDKYLIYALGEIVLVIVGILIALQINDWNDHRKNEILFKTYRTNLIKNLVKDSVNLEQNLANISEESVALLELERRTSISVSPLDTIAYISRYDYRLFDLGYVR